MDRSLKDRDRRSLSVPYRRKKNRWDDEAGFSQSQYAGEFNYNHDTSTIKMSIQVLGIEGKKLHKMRNDIDRKRQQEKSKKLESCKDKYRVCLSVICKEVETITQIVSEKKEIVNMDQKTATCDECFEREKKLQRLYADMDRQKRMVTEERMAKQEALTRLSAVTSSKLRDNNPNLTDLSDPNRPSKISEMFSELYDNEWTDAYDELSKTRKEIETIHHLNDVIMTAYDCCTRLFKPTRLCFDTESTKIDSEFRQKVIGHIKQNATVVISKLKQDVEREVRKRCNIQTPTPGVDRYLQKSIEICWLMAIQDPPMHLHNSNSTTPKFDSAKFRDYQNRGKYTDYDVWPAIALCEGGALLSKGVAQGTDTPRSETTRNYKQTGDNSRMKRASHSDMKMTETWHPSNKSSHNSRSVFNKRVPYSTDM